MLAICPPKGKVTVYVNELELRARIRVTGPVEAGQAVTRDDIADIERLELGVQIPDDAGFLFLFSVGWRKGLFYDFGPIIGQTPERRQYDVAVSLGRAYCHVVFQDRFSISDAEWNSLLKAQWFPFIGLRDATISDLINHVRSGWNPDEKIDAIVSETKKGVPQMLNSWRTHSSFSPHTKILERAVKQFQNDDFISCTGLLFTRIEGILRTYQKSLDTPLSPSPDNLTRTAVAAKIENDKSLLLPHRFARYLQDIYFADFNPDDRDIEVSRHSVGHGVADTSKFNEKSAVIGILTVHQLFYFLQSAT